MASSTFRATFTATGILTLLLLLFVGRGNAKISLPQSDVDLIEFALNLEYLEAEFFLWAAYNQSLNDIDPSLTQGGPPPIVDRPVNVTDYLRAIIAQLALQEVGHIRFIYYYIIFMLFFIYLCMHVTKNYILTYACSYDIL